MMAANSTFTLSGQVSLTGYITLRVLQFWLYLNGHCFLDRFGFFGCDEQISGDKLAKTRRWEEFPWRDHVIG